MTVSLSAVTKRFSGDIAVDDVDVTIAEGEFFAVLGPSGCGKSTLLRCIAGLERIDAGEIALRGRTVSSARSHVAPEARAVGVVFQSYALWPHMDVRDNVAFPVECNGKSRQDARQEAARHLQTVALQDYAARRPAELSGGQRQRVALARCLAGGARTVLMDEPLANLDPHLRATMEAEIAAFHARAGTTTVYITHDQREAMALADRIAVMARGRFLQVASPHDLYERPANEEVARFIGRSAILTARVADGHARVGEVCVPCRQAARSRPGPQRVVIRPGDIRVGDGEVAARLVRVFYRGGVWEADAEVPGLAERLPIASPRPIREGDAVSLSLTGCWALPGSQAPGDHAGRQAAAEPVE